MFVLVLFGIGIENGEGPFCVGGGCLTEGCNSLVGCCLFL